LDADDWLVAENTVLMADNTMNETGVWLQGCRRAEVSCNTITGATASYPLKSQAAIRNVMGSDALIGCNDIDRTTNGIIFNGVAPDTEVRGNKIHNHKWGLHLDESAVIGVQDKRGNLWHNTAGAGGVCALYEDSANAVLYPFLVNPAIINGGATMPPSFLPLLWFQPTLSGSNYDCTDDGGFDYCSQFVKRSKERISALDVRVANDSLENDPYTDESKWLLKDRLYYKLDEAPELQDSLQVMAEFYDDLQGSTIPTFKQVDDGQMMLYAIDSAMVAQLRANSAQIDSLAMLVHGGLEQMGDSTLTTSERDAILSGMNIYREGIQNLSVDNAVVLQEAIVDKVLFAGNIQVANASVSASELIETNRKQVNELYLGTIGKQIDGFSTNQASALMIIADQCPMLGGNAVFKARALYSLIDDAYTFNDSMLCATYGIAVKCLGDQRTAALSVVPNPAIDEALLVLGMQLEGQGVFILFDAMGAEVLRYTIPADMPRFAFSTASLAPALYLYQVRGQSGVIGKGKLTIVR
jgi:hypothetical protein